MIRCNTAPGAGEKPSPSQNTVAIPVPDSKTKTEQNTMSTLTEDETSRLQHLEIAPNPQKLTGEVNIIATPTDEYKNPEGAMRKENYATHLKDGTIFDPGKKNIAAHTSKDKDD